MNDLRDNSKAKEFFTREWGTVCKYRTLDFVPTDEYMSRFNGLYTLL